MSFGMKLDGFGQCAVSEIGHLEIAGLRWAKHPITHPARFEPAHAQQSASDDIHYRGDNFRYPDGGFRWNVPFRPR